MAAFSRLGSGRYGVRRAGIFSRAVVSEAGISVGEASAVADAGIITISGTGISVGASQAVGADITSTRGLVQRFSKLASGRWGMRKEGVFAGRGTTTYVAAAGVSVGQADAVAVIGTTFPRTVGHFSKLASGRWGMRLTGDFTGRGGNVTIEQTGVSSGHAVVWADVFTGNRSIPERTRLLVSGWGSRLTGQMARGTPTFAVGAGIVSSQSTAVAVGQLQTNVVLSGTLGAKGRAGITGDIVVTGAPFALGTVALGAKGKGGIAGTLSTGGVFTLGSVTLSAKGKAGVAASELVANNPFDLGVVSLGARGKAGIAGEVQPQAAFELGVVSLGARGKAEIAGRFFGEPWVPVATTQTPNWTPVVKG